MSCTARIRTQDQPEQAPASACALEDVSTLHRFQQADKNCHNLKIVVKTVYETSRESTIAEDDDE